MGGLAKLETLYKVGKLSRRELGNFCAERQRRNISSLVDDQLSLSIDSNLNFRHVTPFLGTPTHTVSQT